jgi:hypothetical protein
MDSKEPEKVRSGNGFRQVSRLTHRRSVKKREIPMPAPLGSFPVHAKELSSRLEVPTPYPLHSASGRQRSGFGRISLSMLGDLHNHQGNIVIEGLALAKGLQFVDDGIDDALGRALGVGHENVV